jgi:hypothetical protein
MVSRLRDGEAAALPRVLGRFVFRALDIFGAMDIFGARDIFMGTPERDREVPMLGTSR